MNKPKIILSILSIFLGNSISLNNQYNDLRIVFYYNSSSLYTDTGRSIEQIINGYYEIRKEFSYDDIKSFDSIEKVLNEKPVFVDDLDRLISRKSFVNCLCVISLGQIEILSFTYDETNDGYALYNGDLIERSKILDDFSKYLISLLEE